MGSWVTFITGQFLVVAKDALAWSRRSFLGFEGLRNAGVAELRSICGTATNKPLTRLAFWGNTDLVLTG
jgi:hypothetical protein